MTVERKKDFLINVLYTCVFVIVTYTVIRFALGYLMPFILGFVIASIVQPLVTWSRKRFGERKWLAILFVALFYAVAAMVLFWAILRVIAYVQYSVPRIEGYYETTLKPALSNLTQSIDQWIQQFDPNVSGLLETSWSEVNETIRVFANSMSKGMVSWATGLVTSIPDLFVSFLIMIISSFFFTLDYHVVVGYFLNKFPKRGQLLLNDVRLMLGTLLGKYLKTYALLMTLTFVELSLGFWILRLNQPILLGFVVAFIDILPVLGTGTVLIPWALYMLISGNIFLGVGLIVLYVLITIIRNVLEPKVIGHEIGLHPLVTLVSLFVGLKLFGFWGLFGLPIAVTILLRLNEEGKFNLLEFFGFRNRSVE